MMYEEFVELIGGKTLSSEDFQLVDFIYTYHPLNLNKGDIAHLYLDYGKMILLDMLPRAKKAAKLEVDLRIAKQTWKDINEAIQLLADVSREVYDLNI